MVCSDSERIADGPFRRASSFGADHERLRVLVRRRQALDDAARRPRMGYPGRPPATGETPEKASGGSSSRKRRPRRSGWSCSRTKRSSFTPRSRRITVIRTLRAIRCSTAGASGAFTRSTRRSRRTAGASSDRRRQGSSNGSRGTGSCTMLRLSECSDGEQPRGASTLRHMVYGRNPVNTVSWAAVIQSPRTLEVRRPRDLRNTSPRPAWTCCTASSGPVPSGRWSR